MKYLLVTVTKALAPLFQWGKGLFFGGKNERTVNFFGSSYNKCRFQRSVGYAACLFFGCRFLLVCALWFSFCPNVLRAEWSQADIDYVKNHLSTIDNSADVSFNRLGLIHDRIYSFNSDNNSHLGILIRQGISDSTSLTNIVSRLDTIITALESLKDSEDGSGDDGTGTTINETWLTEDTFKSDFGGFVDKYDTFLSSWGFDGGSGGTLKDALNSWKKPEKFSAKRYYYYLVEDGSSPFPGNSYPWYTKLESFQVTGTYDSPWEYIVTQLSDMYAEGWLGLAGNLKKQAWNDWQAHTNLIFRLDHIFQLEDKSELSFNSETGQVTLKDAGGSGGEVTDVLPVSTNTVDTAVQAVTNTTESIAGIFNREEIEKRYLNDELLSVGQNYGGIGDEIGAVAAGVLATPWFTIDFNVWGQSYRNALPIDKLNSWRTVAGYIWTLASIVLCVILVRRWGNM